MRLSLTSLEGRQAVHFLPMRPRSRRLPPAAAPRAEASPQRQRRDPSAYRSMDELRAE